jgi:hypothetical protein
LTFVVERKRPQLPKDDDTLLLHEIVFAFSDDEHRTRGVSYDPFGGTAQEHMFQPVWP